MGSPLGGLAAGTSRNGRIVNVGGQAPSDSPRQLNHHLALRAFEAYVNRPPTGVNDRNSCRVNAEPYRPTAMLDHDPGITELNYGVIHPVLFTPAQLAARSTIHGSEAAGKQVGTITGRRGERGAVAASGTGTSVQPPVSKLLMGLRPSAIATHRYGWSLLRCRKDRKRLV